MALLSKKVDGKTTGPTTLEGPIGKKICNNLFYLEDIVNFRPVKPKRKFPKLSREVVKKIAVDQQYLYIIVTAHNVQMASFGL